MTLNARDKAWQSKYEELKAHMALNGEPQVSQEQIKSNTDSEELNKLKSLNYWVKHQRRLFKNDELPEHKIEMLNEIGFTWKVTDGKDSFSIRLRELREYRKKYGTTHVPQLRNEYYKLSRWVNEMRRLYEEERLAGDRIEKLNKIGFIWNVEDDNFERNLKKLKNFYKKYGHWDVPQAGRTKKLGQWVAQVRSRGLKKKRHLEALKASGFEFRPKRHRIKQARNTMMEIDIKRHFRSKKTGT